MIKKTILIAMVSLMAMGTIGCSNSVDEVVVLSCRTVGTVPPIRPIAIDACSASSEEICPSKESDDGTPVPVPSCAEFLGELLSDGYEMQQNLSDADGIVYTLTQK